MLPATQIKGLTCSACAQSVSPQAVQRCKDCNKGYCADCFTKRNNLESKNEKTEGECIPCANTIAIVQLLIDDRNPRTSRAEGQFSHGTSLSSRNTILPSRNEQSQWKSKHGAKPLGIKAGSAAYSTKLYDDEEEMDLEDWDDYGYDDFSADSESYSQTGSKKKDRACPIYCDKNGKRVPYALILAGIVTDYYREPPLTGKRDLSTSLKGSHKLSAGVSVSKKNKNAETKKNSQLVEQKGRKDQFVADGNSQRSKDFSENDSSGWSEELPVLDMKNANMLQFTVSYGPVDKSLTAVQRNTEKQKIKSGEGYSVNTNDLYHSSSDQKETIGFQHRPPVAMILAGYADKKYLQEALTSPVAFLDNTTEQFNIVSRFEQHNTGRHDAVGSKQKSQKNKNSVLTKSSTVVKELTVNSSKNSTEGGSLSGTKIQSTAEDIKQNQSLSLKLQEKSAKESVKNQQPEENTEDIKQNQTSSLKLHGRSVKVTVKMQQSEENKEDQKRQSTCNVGTNSLRNSIKETSKIQEKLKISEQYYETAESNGFESHHLLLEKSMDTITEDIKQNNLKKTNNFEYDETKVETKQPDRCFETISDSKGTSQIRSVGSMPTKIEENFTNESNVESDTDDDDIVPYALHLAGICRELVRKKEKTESCSDKPFALQPPNADANHPQGGYPAFALTFGQENETQPDISRKSGNRKLMIVISHPSSFCMIATKEDGLKSTNDANNGSSGKTENKAPKINKNVNHSLHMKVASLDTETVKKRDDMPTKIAQVYGLEELRDRNSHVKAKGEKLMDEGTKNETDASENPGSNNTVNDNMVSNPRRKWLSETKAKLPSEDSVQASTLVSFDSSMSETMEDADDSLQRINQPDSATIAVSECNPLELMPRKEEYEDGDENEAVTLLANTIDDKLNNHQPDVQYEISPACDTNNEANPSASDQLRPLLEEDFEQTSQGANIKTSKHDVDNKKEDVDNSQAQFHSESNSPSQPSGTMKNSFVRQSSSQKEKDGHTCENVTMRDVETLKPNSANNQQRNELCDPSSVSDIDHSDIHHAFNNIGRKRAQRSTLCCIGCGRPECKSNMMQNMLWINQAAKKNGLQVCDVTPDGNCMFTALVDQLHFQGDYRFDAWSLRQNAVNWLRNNPCSKDGTHYSSFLDSESWEEYLLRLSQETQWGDHVILRAISEFLNRTIEVFTPKNTSEALDFHITKIEPEFNTPALDEKSLLLGHVGESHYVSLRSKDPTVIEQEENEKSHYTEEMEKKVIIDEWKDEERENPQRVSADCKEKIQIFEETYFDTWSDCPGIHLSFAIKKTFLPAAVLQGANSVSNELLSRENDVQDFFSRSTVYQGTPVKMLVGSVIEGLYCADLDVPQERGLSYDWGEITEIFVRQDLQIIKDTHLTENMNNLWMEEDSIHPGFVRLISTSLAIQQVHGVSIPGSPQKYISNNSFKSPKQTYYYSYSKYKKFHIRDTVGIRCLYWPKSAEKWVSRKRFEGWPPEIIIHDIVNEGCLVFPVQNMKIQYPEVAFQISFALAEKKLALNAVSSEQRYCYIIWKAICNQVFKGKNLLEAVYYKTIFFFACETVPAEHWKNHPGPCILYMFDELMKCIRERYLPSYFLPKNNLLDVTDAEKLKDAEEILVNLRSNILLYARLLMETTFKRTDILEKVIDNIQQFKLNQSARLTTLEFFVPEAIELAKESVKYENYKEGYECLMQAYEDRLAVCTCDDQMPINLFIHGAVSDVSIVPTTWFLVYCEEHLQGQLTISLMQEICSFNGQELIRIGHILPADICGKYTDALVPQRIAWDLCTFCCQFAKYLHHIGSNNHALQVLYYCIHRHKELEEKMSQPGLTENENKMDGKEPTDLGSDFNDYNMLSIYSMLHKVYSTRNEIKLLEQHLTDIVQLVEKIGNSKAFFQLKTFLSDLNDKEAEEKACIRYQELKQKEAELRDEKKV